MLLLLQLPVLAQQLLIRFAAAPCPVLSAPAPICRRVQLCELCVCGSVAAERAGRGAVHLKHHLWPLCEQGESEGGAWGVSSSELPCCGSWHTASIGGAQPCLLAGLHQAWCLHGARAAAALAAAAQVTKRVVFATAVVCTGCVLLVSFGNHESPTLSTHDMLELYSK